MHPFLQHKKVSITIDRPINPNVYGALPPEINSGRMYTGVGSTPLLAAAASWDTLATALSSMAAAYSSMLFDLASSRWRGPTAVAMIRAVTPYVAWLHTTATQAERTGMQARTAAASYEAAFAMTVPPPVITANRVSLMTLIASNLLGQNTAAIAAVEAEYSEFWAQDAAAMYYYAATSAAASVFTPFEPPPNTSNPDSAPRLIRQLTPPKPPPWFPILPTTDLNALVNTWGLAYFGMGILQLGTLFAQQFFQEQALEVGATGAAVGASGFLRAAGEPVVAGSGEAERVGPMSVPLTWAVSASDLRISTQGISSAAVANAPIDTSGPLFQGVPLQAQRPANFARRRYGRRFRVISRPPAAG